MHFIQVICVALSFCPLFGIPLSEHEPILSKNQIKFIEMAEKARNSAVDFCYATRSDSVDLIEIARQSLNDNFEKCSNESIDYAHCFNQIEKTIYKKVHEKYGGSGGSWFVSVNQYDHNCSKPDEDYVGRSYFSLGEFKFIFEEDDDGACGYMGKVGTRKHLTD